MSLFPISAKRFNLRMAHRAKLLACSRRHIRIGIIFAVIGGAFVFLSQLNLWSPHLLREDHVSISKTGARINSGMVTNEEELMNVEGAQRRPLHEWVIHVIKVPSDDEIGTPKDADDLKNKDRVPEVQVTAKPEKVVNPHDFEYIHNKPDICVKDVPELVIGVIGKTDNFEARKAIRDTWGHMEKGSPFKVLVLFFLGSTANKTVQTLIDKEAKEKGDIVQEDFVDSYRNLSIKTVALMRWASTFCNKSSYVLKSDDDLYINVPVLVKKLRDWSRDHKSDFIIGYVHNNITVIRNQRSKYMVDKNEFSSSQFPSYVSGTSYALTTGAAGKLYKASFYVPRLFLEDVYITGLLAKKANVPRLREYGFRKYEFHGCSIRDHISSGHSNSPSKIRQMHEELLDKNKKCK